MTAITETPEHTDEQQVEPEQPQAEAERAADKIYKWSTWVHVGEGASDCEQRFSGRCQVDEHFHAWCRLPNPFQIRDITEKSQAAAAIRRRALRNPEADARIIMEDELDALRESAQDPDGKEILVDELIDKDFADNWQAAVRHVMELEDEGYEPKDGEEPPKLYADIEQNREEYNRLKTLPEEQRGDDFTTLEQYVADYSRAIEAEMDRLQAPRKQHLMEREVDELIDMVRRDRIEANVTEVYLHTFNMWTWYVCTLKPRDKGTPNERVWPDINILRHQEAPEVIRAIQDTFRALENEAVQGGRGKG